MSLLGPNPRLIKCQSGEAGCFGAKVIPGKLWEQLEEAACQRFSSTPSSSSLIRNNTTILINVAVLLVSQDHLPHQRVNASPQKTLTGLRSTYIEKTSSNEL